VKSTAVLFIMVPVQVAVPFTLYAPTALICFSGWSEEIVGRLGFGQFAK
jgi:hypothetical protein